MEDALKEYDLHVEWSEAKDREPIDFEIRDDHGDLCATVWGSEPFNDIQIDCEHPVTEFEDDETVGECPICGATCTWHYEPYADDGYMAQDQVIDQWDYPKKIGGIVGKYLEEEQKRW